MSPHRVAVHCVDLPSALWTRNPLCELVVHCVDSPSTVWTRSPLCGLTVHCVDSPSTVWTRSPLCGLTVHSVDSSSTLLTRRPLCGLAIHSDYFHEFTVDFIDLHGLNVHFIDWEQLLCKLQRVDLIDGWYVTLCRRVHSRTAIRRSWIRAAAATDVKSVSGNFPTSNGASFSM